MSRPKLWGVEYISQAQQEGWEAKHGEFWADTVCPETRTQIASFNTEAQARHFLQLDTPNAPSGYCDRLFRRDNIHWDCGWSWDEKDFDPHP